MAREKGNTTPLFTLKTGAGSAVDFGPDVVSLTFVDGEGGPVTISDYNAGIRPVAIEVEFVLDFAVDKAHQYHWTNAGATNVTYVVQKSSGAVSQANPKFTGTLTMPASPLISLEGSNEALTWSTTYQLDSYTKVIA